MSVGSEFRRLLRVGHACVGASSGDIRLVIRRSVNCLRRRFLRIVLRLPIHIVRCQILCRSCVLLIVDILQMFVRYELRQNLLVGLISVISRLVKIVLVIRRSVDILNLIGRCHIRLVVFIRRFHVRLVVVAGLL